jgi:dTDP-4-amino-4,6-dideoxygalactose transaminase
VRNDIYSLFHAERRDLPNTDWIDAREVSLPCGWWVGAADQDRIVETLKKAVQ